MADSSELLTAEELACLNIDDTYVTFSIDLHEYVKLMSIIYGQGKLPALKGNVRNNRIDIRIQLKEYLKILTVVTRLEKDAVLINCNVKIENPSIYISSDDTTGISLNRDTNEYKSSLQKLFGGTIHQ